MCLNEIQNGYDTKSPLWLKNVSLLTHPTVVMVTTAHHMPSAIPLQNRLGNCSGFDPLSLRKKKKASAEETKCVRITCLNFLLFIVGRYVRLTLVDNCGFSFTNSVSLIFSSCCRWLVFAIIKWSSNVFNKL